MPQRVASVKVPVVMEVVVGVVVVVAIVVALRGRQGPSGMGCKQGVRDSGARGGCAFVGVGVRLVLLS